MCVKKKFEIILIKRLHKEIANKNLVKYYVIGIVLTMGARVSNFILDYFPDYEIYAYLFTFLAIIGGLLIFYNLALIIKTKKRLKEELENTDEKIIEQEYLEYKNFDIFLMEEAKKRGIRKDFYIAIAINVVAMLLLIYGVYAMYLASYVAVMLLIVGFIFVMKYAIELDRLRKQLSENR